MITIIIISVQLMIVGYIFWLFADLFGFVEHNDKFDKHIIIDDKNLIQP